MSGTLVVTERRQDQVTDFDAIIIGAGISGMFTLYRLRELGMTARVFETGTNVGGTWYWNRYPGARFDSESWTYGYSFSKELMREWDWKEHFSPQPDTLEYLNHVADKFDLRRDMQFRSKTLDVPPEEREAFWEKLYAEPGFGIWIGNFRDIMVNEKANAEISAFIARKIRLRVKDPGVADKLIPKDHGFGTRRVPLESGYFEAFNRDNVLLVDTLHDEPIECITPNGIRTSRQEHEFDILIYATGFDGVTGAFDRIDIRGVNGLRLKDAWADSPRTYLGMLAEGFPNMLMVLGPHTARGNIPQAVEHSVEFQTGILRFMREHDYTRVETRPEQVAEWTETVIKAAEPLLSSKVDSWQTGVNRNVEGRSVRRVLGYNGHGVHFRRKTDEVANGGYTEFAFR